MYVMRGSSLCLLSMFCSPSKGQAIMRDEHHRKQGQCGSIQGNEIHSMLQRSLCLLYTGACTFRDLLL